MTSNERTIRCDGCSRHIPYIGSYKRIINSCEHYYCQSCNESYDNGEFDRDYHNKVYDAHQGFGKYW